MLPNVQSLCHNHHVDLANLDNTIPIELVSCQLNKPLPQAMYVNNILFKHTTFKRQGKWWQPDGQCLQIMPWLHSNVKLEKEIETKQTAFHGQNSKHHLHQAGKYQLTC